MAESIEVKSPVSAGSTRRGFVIGFVIGVFVGALGSAVYLVSQVYGS